MHLGCGIRVAATPLAPVRGSGTLVETMYESANSTQDEESLLLLLFFLADSLYIEVDTRYADMEDEFVIAQSW